MSTHSQIWNLTGTDDPAGGIPAPIGAQYSHAVTGLLYVKVGPLDTDWALVASQYMLPTSWFALSLATTFAFVDMSTELSFTSSFRAIRPGRVVGISTLITGGPITSGVVGVKLKKNASPLFPEYLMNSGTFPNGGHFDLNAQDPAYTAYAADDTLTVQVAASAAVPAGAMNIAAWLQVRE